ncbi:MAG TPA: hypothetical protein VJ124_02950 [Pyrinomonadaceae bacterium]|nr:hypothetical protein [Pyrinomonadaceae bacterium]
MSDLSKLLENVSGESWLALTQDEKKIVGRGEDIAPAIEEAKENGEDDPLLVWSPKAWIPAVYSSVKH